MKIRRILPSQKLKRRKHIVAARNYIKRTPIFDIGSISRLVGNCDYSYVLINNLLKKGEIRRITKGYYSIHDDPVLAAYCFKPCYIGLEEAMSFHGIWEQETNVILVTTKKVRRETRKIFGTNAFIRNISPKYFFGFDYFKYGDFVVPISDVEKTFIDIVYFRRTGKGLDNEALKEFGKKIDRKKLNSYLKRYSARFRKKVLGEMQK